MCEAALCARRQWCTALRVRRALVRACAPKRLKAYVNECTRAVDACVLASSGAVVPWSSGAQEQRRRCSHEQWCSGSLEQWCARA